MTSIKESSYQLVFENKHTKDVPSDIEFIVGEKKCSFKAHKFMLAEANAVFNCMFYGNLPETGNVLTISDLDPEGFRCFLDFLYNQAENWNNFEEVASTYIAANKYLDSSLQEICKKSITGNFLNAFKVYKILNLFFLYEDRTSTDLCIKFISRLSTKAFFHSNRFLEMSSESMESILKTDVLAISENDLLNALGLWLKCNGDLANSSSKKKVKSHLQLLNLIRFNSISAIEFELFVYNFKDLVPEAYSLPIKKYLMRNESELPYWCSTAIRRKWNSHYKIGSLVNLFQLSYDSLQSDLFLSIYSLTQKIQNATLTSLDYIELCWEYSGSIPTFFNVTLFIVAPSVVKKVFKYRIMVDVEDDDNVMRVWLPVMFQLTEPMLRLHLTVKFSSICNVNFPSMTYCSDGIRGLETDCYACISDVIFNNSTTEGVSAEVALQNISKKYSAQQFAMDITDSNINQFVSGENHL